MKDIQNIQALFEKDKHHTVIDGRYSSSVLIPLVENDSGQLEVLFEQRSFLLEHQPGDVCFPGGRMEENETAEETAIRETMEELCISEEMIEIVGSLDGTIGPYGMPVWPYIGFLKNYAGTFSDAEVDHVIRIPLDWLLTYEPKMYELENITIPPDNFPFEKIYNGRQYTFAKRKTKVYFYEYENTVIWGLTGRILEQFIRKIKDNKE